MRALLSVTFAIFVVSAFAFAYKAGFASTSSRASAQSPDPQTTLGSTLSVPASINLQWAQHWRYSPGGDKMAIGGLRSIYVWTLDSGEVCDLLPQPDRDELAACLGPWFCWADGDHILALETQNSLAEAAARAADRSQPFPACVERLALFDVRTGERVRSTSMVEVTGTADADVWYIRANDGKLRTYDSRTGEVGSEAFFDYRAGAGVAAQVAPGSDWFFNVVSDDPDNPCKFYGRLEVFNVQTGEKRTWDHVSQAPSNPLTITPDARFFIKSTAGPIGPVPHVYDLVTGQELSVPDGERWAPYLLSPERSALLVMLVRPGPERHDPFNITYVEIALRDLIPS